MKTIIYELFREIDFTKKIISLGYRLAPDGRSCVDIDECSEYGQICTGHCVNEPGSYRCTCPQGYVLSPNERSCQDIDECQQGPSPCRGSNQHCFNTRGGFKCVGEYCKKVI